MSFPFIKKNSLHLHNFPDICSPLSLSPQHSEKMRRASGRGMCHVFPNDLLYNSGAKVSQRECTHRRTTAQTWRLHITNSPSLFATEQLHWSRWEMSVWWKRKHYSLISSAHIFTASLGIWIIHLTATNFCHLIIWGALFII